MLVVDTTSSTQSQMDAIKAAFEARECDIPFLCFAESGLKNRQVGADIGQYGKVSLYINSAYIARLIATKKPTQIALAKKITALATDLQEQMASLSSGSSSVLSSQLVVRGLRKATFDTAELAPDPIDESPPLATARARDAHDDDDDGVDEREDREEPKPKPAQNGEAFAFRTPVDPFHESAVHTRVDVYGSASVFGGGGFGSPSSAHPHSSLQSLSLSHIPDPAAVAAREKAERTRVKEEARTAERTRVKETSKDKAKPGKPVIKEKEEEASNNSSKRRMIARDNAVPGAPPDPMPAPVTDTPPTRSLLSDVHKRKQF